MSHSDPKFIRAGLRLANLLARGELLGKVVSQQVGHFLGVHRDGKEISLQQITLFVDQVAHLFGGFDALCNHAQVESARQGENRIDDRGTVRAAKIGNEALIDFQGVNWETLEVTQG